MAARWTAPVEVALTTELYGGLSEHERAMLPLLLDACAEMDNIFWQEAYGDRDALLSTIDDPEARRFAEFNYGPWDRRAGNAPFLSEVGPKPLGAQFYPADMTSAEFEAACAESPERAVALRSQYTLVRRDAAGRLVGVPYHEAFADSVERAAARLRAAAILADDPGLRTYLELRAEALLTDDYRPSDVAWLDMKSNGIDVIIGPIENFEDALYGCKTAHAGVVLLKDREWSARLSSLTEALPELQRGLPVPDAYKKETPGSDGQLGVYDAVAFAGHANAIPPQAVNLPNDEDLQLTKGTRRLQLRNAMRWVFDQTIVPVIDSLIDADQRSDVRFEAYFECVMCHEIAHGLGIKHTIGGTRSVREALREQEGVVEEGKADIVGLHLLARLKAAGELPEASLASANVTFVAELLRQIRKGSASEHSRAALANLGFLLETGAISRHPGTGTYRVDVPTMARAIDTLAERYLRLQGDGDYDGALAFIPKDMGLNPTLKVDLDRLAAANIPIGVRFVPATDLSIAGTRS
jgi:Peptidase family M49